MTLDRIVTMTFHHIVATVVLDNIDTFDTIIAFDIPLAVLLTSSPAMWRTEHLCSFSVLQRVHISILVKFCFAYISMEEFEGKWPSRIIPCMFVF
jgi:hypothetical protein